MKKALVSLSILAAAVLGGVGTAAPTFASGPPAAKAPVARRACAKGSHFSHKLGHCVPNGNRLPARKRA